MAGNLDHALAAMRAIAPPLDPKKHKGQAGKIAVIGGCREYTGAPYFSAISALKMGADLSHVFCTNGAATVIKSYSPELIVHPIFVESHELADESQESQQATKNKTLSEIDRWISGFSCLVIGPGLGRDPLLLDCVSEIIRKARAKEIPMVLDGDGLFLVTSEPELISGYALATLTPNINEHKRLAQKIKGAEHEVQTDKIPDELKSLASQLGGVTILQKGFTDYMSDGTSVLACDFYGSPRRCGGQGDILSGTVAVFTSWARQCKGSPDMEKLSRNPCMLGALAGSVLVRRAAQDAFTRHRRSTVTGNIIECLQASMDELCPL
ncbi:ATP-dependent (S)-NAD(P)H-hydrate dehydratase [Selaginella moellendorffii]|uniref:ATP-dependent (S)-NAD(P)H-hydrate dehydratase n=1 Tax=Selaginella moellendorffii TaxID=88036 RepID=UPI000D1CC16F|nr:ATP-dependent (S)-NAD(P)H-hydrate dehydratase [Selaginella moellendorffii]|eukprot:XP_002962734.2 ATP-dependent (S)-NAD(P)H-hydrate dehydratase [Selaginella moellendorffii]